MLAFAMMAAIRHHVLSAQEFRFATSERHGHNPATARVILAATPSRPTEKLHLPNKGKWTDIEELGCCRGGRDRSPR